LADGPRRLGCERPPEPLCHFPLDGLVVLQGS